MEWVESQRDGFHLFLVPRIQQICVGRVDKHVEFIGQFQEVHWGRARWPLVLFVLYYLPHFVHFLKPNSD
jgi:hypothetical protein